MGVVEGDKLGKYQVVGILGRGAMGTVYDGRDPFIDRRVAIKTIGLEGDADAGEDLARFRREAQAAGRLSHPNIVSVFDTGETASLAYIVMEFVDGKSLKDLLDAQERFTPAEAVRVMDGVLAGLQYSHSRGVVHRDIKPANIMLTQEGAVKIADFGIARIESSQMTQAGTVMGTPAYMSPEQFMGQTVDLRTDLYSAGVLLYQMLTGERPFDGSITAIMHKALNTEPPRPSALSVTSPVGLDAVVATAMAKRPDQRFPTAAAFAADMHLAMAPSALPDSDATIVVPGRVAASPGAAGVAAVAAMMGSRGPSVPAADPPSPPVSAAPVAGPPPRRAMRPLLLTAAAAVVIIGVAGGAFVLLRQKLPTSPAQPSRMIAPPPPMPAPTVSPLAAATVSPLAAATVSPLAAHSTPPSSAAPHPAAPQPARPAAADPAAITAAIRHALGTATCALTSGRVQANGTVSIDGVVGQSQAATLRHAVTSAADAPLDWKVAAATGPYCEALDDLRAAAPAFGQPDDGFTVDLAHGLRRLLLNDNLEPTIGIPDFQAYLTVDYYSSDGGLTHIFPRLGDRRRSFPAGATAVFGDAADRHQLPVGPPYGTDLMVAIVSQTPLFTSLQPETESAASYLPKLKRALAKASQEGRVQAAAIVIQTAAR